MTARTSVWRQLDPTQIFFRVPFTLTLRITPLILADGSNHALRRSMVPGHAFSLGSWGKQLQCQAPLGYLIHRASECMGNFEVPDSRRSCVSRNKTLPGPAVPGGRCHARDRDPRGAMPARDSFLLSLPTTQPIYFLFLTTRRSAQNRPDHSKFAIHIVSIHRRSRGQR